MSFSTLLEKIPVGQWTYVSEGNANIVFRVQADSPSPSDSCSSTVDAKEEDTDDAASFDLNGWVVRINKTPLKAKAIPTVESDTCDAGSKWPTKLVHALIGEEYTVRCKGPFRLSSAFVSSLMTVTNEIRPPKRVAKHKLTDGIGDDIEYECALHSDCCTLEVTWELKPKQLVMPSASAPLPESHVRRHLCEFSQMQQLKAQSGVLKPEHVCELCLVSTLGTVLKASTEAKHRVALWRAALRKWLVATKGGQSYLKVTQRIETEANIDSQIETVSRILATEKAVKVWAALCRLQRLDQFDTDTAALAYAECLRRIGDDCSSRLADLICLHSAASYDSISKHMDKAVDCLLRKLRLAEPLEIGTCECSELLYATSEHSLECMRSFSTALDGAHSPVSEWTDAQLVECVNCYLVRRVFNDCSLLVSFDTHSASRFQLTLIDLDPKPVQRLEHKWPVAAKRMAQCVAERLSEHI